MVMKRKGRSGQHEDASSLGYFLQCNADVDSSWTCNATAKLRILPHKSDVPMVERGWPCIDMVINILVHLEFFRHQSYILQQGK